jgi:hypothetical protein
VLLPLQLRRQKPALIACGSLPQATQPDGTSGSGTAGGRKRFPVCRFFSWACRGLSCTGEARDIEPQGPGVRAAGGPAELQGT